MFPHSQRIAKKDFSKIFQSGKRIHTPELTVIVLPTKTSRAQFAVIVGKSVDKRAVVRNRIKRRVRKVCMRLSPTLPPGYAISIIVKKNIADKKEALIEKELKRVFSAL